jgi:hypothetical protein
MSQLTSPLFVNAVIDCIGEGRAPTSAEMLLAAQRIWSDSAASRPAFLWNSLSVSSPHRRDSMLAASLALHGSQ